MSPTFKIETNYVITGSYILDYLEKSEAPKEVYEKCKQEIIDLLIKIPKTRNVDESKSETKSFNNPCDLINRSNLNNYINSYLHSK